MSILNSCIGIYKTHTAAENGIKELQRAGFNMKEIPIVGKGYHAEEQAAGFYHPVERVKFWGKCGAFGGGLLGFLCGWAFFCIYGLEPLIAARPLVSMILVGLEGAAAMGGLTALGAALYSIGIPEACIVAYGTAIKTESFSLIVHGTKNQITCAKEIMSTQPGVQIAARMN